MEIYSKIQMGININDSDYPWSDLIFSGKKIIETRNTNSLKSYIGKRLGVIRTGKGKAMLVGLITLGNPIIYNDAEEFRKDEDKHCVHINSIYNFPENGVKYGYPLYNPYKIIPVEVDSKGYVARFIGDLIQEIHE